MQFENAVSDWITSQKEKSSCKFGTLQDIKVIRARTYSNTGTGNKRTTWRKSNLNRTHDHNTLSSGVLDNLEN